MAARDKLTATKIKTFLEVVERTGNISLAAQTICCSRTAIYNRKKQDEKFSAAWEEAVENGVDVLLEEARRRAVEGIEEPVFHLGEVCGHVRRYSDSLLMFLIKGKRPEYAGRPREDGKEGGIQIIKMFGGFPDDGKDNSGNVIQGGWEK